MRHTFSARLLIAMLAWCLASCADVGGPSGELAAVKSDSGALSVVVETVPGASLERGTNSLELRLTNESGFRSS